jgi:hypothetical protein
MKLDSFIREINQLRIGQQTDDADPNNILLYRYTNPYDIISFSDTFRAFKTGVNMVWSDGSYYVAYDNNGVAWNAPSCNWLWGVGGRWN